MGTKTGPSIVTDGLVLSMDVANTKSFAGEPTDNLYGDISLSASLRPYRIKYTGNTPINTLFYKHTSGSLSSSWNGNSYGYTLKDLPVTQGVEYVLSVWVYVSTDCNIDSLPCGIEQETSEFSVQGYSQYYDLNKKGTWQKLARGCLGGAGTTTRFLPIYPRKYGVTDGSFYGYYIWGGVQVEQKDHVTPFVDSTRSATNALKDLSGNGNHGDFVNEPLFDSNNLGSISFDGVDDYISFNNEYSFSTGNGTYYTFEVWFKMRVLPVTTYGNNGHIWGGEIGNDVVLYLNPESNGISKGIIVYDDTRYANEMMTNNGFSADTWAQWVIVGDGVNNTITHYINGELDKNNSPVTPSTQYIRSWSGTRIAYDARWGTYSTLNLGSCKQYNRSLTSNEVKQNYNALRGRYGL